MSYATIEYVRAGEYFIDRHGLHEVKPGCGLPSQDVFCLTHARGFGTRNERAMHLASGEHRIVRVCPTHGFEGVTPLSPAPLRAA